LRFLACLAVNKIKAMTENRINSIIVGKPQKPIKTSISLPASKSISNRLLIIKELSGKDLNILNISKSDDTTLLNDLLLKIKETTVSESSDNTVELDTKNVGTIMRFLTSFLAIRPGNWMLTGNERMKSRPIGELVDSLRSIGADISYLENIGFPPLLIKGKNLQGGVIEINAELSSQFISSLLLIAPKLKNGLIIKVNGKISSAPYIEMTIKILGNFGINISRFENKIEIRNQNYFPQNYEVEADWSAASYWYEIVALSNKAEIFLTGLKKNSLQGDSRLAEIFKYLGVETKYLEKGILLKKKNKFFKNIKIDFNDIPDLAPAIIVSCAGLGIKGKFAGMKNLKIKESDRIFAIKTELKKIGFDLNETIKNKEWVLKLSSDNDVINQVNNIVFETYDDHRIAMAYAPLSILYNSVTIINPNVVEKSYPNFWDHLKKAGFTIF
jgi:3-phosphoshikimate 1-carboxyvinyltransferase